MSAARALYAATLDLTGATVVVVGAGAVALRKIQGLPAGVKRVRVVAPQVSGPVAALAKARPEIEIVQRAFEGGDLRHCRLLFCCASDAGVNAFAALQARALGVWVCQASDPEDGDLRVPAVVHAGGIAMTISTHGASPALAKALRIHFERLLKASDLAWLLARLEALRPRMKADPALKERLVGRVTEPANVARALAPRSKAGRERLQRLLKP
jgi:siroheme synthase-like protein